MWNNSNNKFIKIYSLWLIDNISQVLAVPEQIPAQAAVNHQ